MLADNNLISIQRTGILAENAAWAHRRLAAFSRQAPDRIAEGMADAAGREAGEPAGIPWKKTDLGRRDRQCRHFSPHPGALRTMPCVLKLRRAA